MSANIAKILIIGATSGIGEGFAKHFHAKGKTVIAAGRRLERLNALKAQLPGLEIFQLDIEDINDLESNLNELLKKHPDLDSVFILAAKMDYFWLTDAADSTSQSIISGANTNFIAPMLIARVMIPHFKSLRRSTTFIITTSGLAFIPISMWPTYAAAKAGLHYFTVCLRTQATCSNVNVIEVVPPFVDTDIDIQFRERMMKQFGDAIQPPMPLQEYVDVAAAMLEKEGVKE